MLPTSFFSLSAPPPPRSTLFPYTTLFRSRINLTGRAKLAAIRAHLDARQFAYVGNSRKDLPVWCEAASGICVNARSEEHTSDSSHQIISYAVFCLKKKKTNLLTHALLVIL